MPAESLRAALATLDTSPLDEDAKEKLRLKVIEFVDVALHAGWPPERMLVEAKRLLADSGYRRRTVITVKDLDSREAIVSGILRMCIEEYFGRTDREKP
jgi:hypothetical protein